MAETADDCWVVPLCVDHHLNDPKRAQHSMNEMEFWRGHGIDPFPIALALFAHSGNEEVCRDIIRRAAL